MKTKSFITTLLLLSACFLSISLQAQDSSRHSINPNKGKFAIGLAAETVEKRHLPVSIQGEYLQKNWFIHSNFTFSPIHSQKSDENLTYHVRDQYMKFSLMSGIRLGKQRHYEISAGYTLIGGNFTHYYFAPGLYKIDTKGIFFNHYISLNTGYRFNLGQHFFIKPEVSFNYRVAKETKFDRDILEYYNGPGPIEHHEMIFWENFHLYFRLGVGYTFGK